ncbi:NAD(P)/FAD-dependent oxidoreductase [Conexibacter sp. SYSU D00693]|uniref:flavin-containing monooxygenase n=1 Tax=Conexibacter sp. SYSU D00693 TaxID=2812560 RepID=UPI00196B028E|nr:NAD(P)/FAD-dependent oxidoreductase [Conexibacter sp. SYSU D00693]
MTATATATDHVDVLVVGAGLSGIGAAWHLQDKLPGKSYAILEAREASGGTWDLFRYPGIRSDSDLSTFAYAFKPWTGEKAIADGPDILRYLRETASEAGIDQHIRYGHKVLAASWSSEDARWTVRAEHDGETVELTCGWLFCASGYYRYDEGFRPRFAGEEDFAGRLVHPQHWPEDLDVAGKRIVVIGSGATSVTLVPALARQGAHVTMLQRSPSYVLPLPEKDPIADLLRRVFGDQRGHELTRRKNVARQRWLYSFCQKRPNAARKLIRWVNARQLEGSGVDVDVHFNPKYGPWDQRLCAVPNGDLFRSLRKGDAEIVTAKIDRFTEGGVRLEDGRELEADVIVTATGLNLLIFGGMQFEVDGRPVSIPETMAYKGMMGSGVPNFAFAIGYTNSSWTLKVDLVCEHLCRLLAHMDRCGFDTAMPVNSDPAMEQRPLLDFKAGYVLRALDKLPKAGSREPWHLAMDYKKDVAFLRGPVEDPELRLERRAVRGRDADELQAAAA